MPFTQRYSNIKNGGILFLGNTLGLSKAPNSLSAGTLGSIGAFVSTDNSLQVGNFPSGTTSNYLQNGSASSLGMPSGSKVLYAELVWGGLFRSSVNNISQLIDNNVEFQTPSGTFSVMPDNVTKQTFTINVSGVVLGFYVRTANVTQIVKAAQNGVYACGKVPSLIEAFDQRTSETNHAGWTLAVVFENDSLPLRNLTLWSGGAVVSPDGGVTDVTLTGFLTPEQLPLGGKLFVSAQEGDAVIKGDKLLFGKDVASLSPLSGPNNPTDNFFCSQINGSDGLLDTTGTFGSRNANAFAGTNTSACRQGWDITAVDVSALLATAETTAAVRFTTDGDLYVPNCLALQIDSKGARISVAKSADKTFALFGEEVTYTLVIKNTGDIDAKNVVLNDAVPTGLQFVLNSLTLGGAPYAGSFPVNIGTLAPGQSVDVTFEAKAATLPVVNPVVNVARADCSFDPFPGYTVSSFSDSNSAECFFVNTDVSVTKSVDKNYAEAGETLTYLSVVKNNSNVKIVNLFFKDQIPTGTSFVSGSVTVDGVAYPLYDPEAGFYLTELLPGQSAKVEFDVKVN